MSKRRQVSLLELLQDKPLLEEFAAKLANKPTTPRDTEGEAGPCARIRPGILAS